MYVLDKIIIEGGRRLCGEIEVHGSKNSALPILAATVLTGDKCKIHNCPALSDVDAAIQILRHLGCKVVRDGHTVEVDSSVITVSEIPDDLMREMRSSIVFLGAVLARTGKAEISSPGGCEIGLRPIDLHLSSMRKLGAEITEEHGRLYCSLGKCLHGADITLSFPSVGATENIMIAAAAADGTTVITNAAREPEISDLADFLNGCGAKISGAGDSTVVIEGTKKLHGTCHTVIPDRIEASSYLIAASATGGRICIKDVIPAHIGALIPVLSEAGCDITTSGRWICLSAPPRLKRVKMIRTMPYPGFPTDAQAIVGAMLSVADGTSVIIENIFESRFKHVTELMRLGAKISVEGRMAVIEGSKYLTGANVVAPDLRGGFALITAGLAANGKTVITGTQHLDRGYEAPEKVLKLLGADVRRINENDGTEKQETRQLAENVGKPAGESAEDCTDRHSQEADDRCNIRRGK